ncbi:MAG: hypothetical protein ACLS4Z_09475 [Christensenellaceae bacterium]
MHEYDRARVFLLPYDVVDLLCGNSFPVLRVDRPVDKRGFRLFFYFIVKVAVTAEEVISLPSILQRISSTTEISSWIFRAAAS